MQVHPLNVYYFRFVVWFGNSLVCLVCLDDERTFSLFYSPFLSPQILHISPREKLWKWQLPLRNENNKNDDKNAQRKSQWFELRRFRFATSPFSPAPTLLNENDDDVDVILIVFFATCPRIFSLFAITIKPDAEWRPLSTIRITFLHFCSLNE